MSLKSASKKAVACVLLCAFAIVVLNLLSTTPAKAQSQNMPKLPSLSALPKPAPMPDNDEERIQQLVLAYHILFTQGVIDGWDT